LSITASGDLVTETLDHRVELLDYRFVLRFIVLHRLLEVRDFRREVGIVSHE
jgi:hypothetical protein